MSQREKEMAERRRIEDQLREAQEADVKKQSERRQYLKNLTEEDRKAKLMHKMKEPEPLALQGQDNISKLFDRPTHQAYDRRAKQDLVVQHMSEKFTAPNEDKERLRNANANQVGFNSQFAPELAQSMESKRKEKTQQMKNMLQMQIDLQNKEKDQKAEEKRAIAQKIAQD